MATASAQLREMHRRIKGTDLDGIEVLRARTLCVRVGTRHAGRSDRARPRRVRYRPDLVAKGRVLAGMAARSARCWGYATATYPTHGTVSRCTSSDMIDNVLCTNDVIAVRGTAARATGGSPFRVATGEAVGRCGKAPGPLRRVPGPRHHGSEVARQVRDPVVVAPTVRVRPHRRRPSSGAATHAGTAAAFRSNRTQDPGPGRSLPARSPDATSQADPHFRGPFADGPPPSALAINAPDVTKAGPRDLVRLVVVYAHDR